MTEPVPVDEGARNQRALLILAGVIGVVLVAFIGSRLLGGGDDDSASERPDRPRPNGQAAPRSTTTSTTGLPPVESFEVFTTKNPFIPLRGGDGGGGGPVAPGFPGTPTPTTVVGGPVTTPTTFRPGTTPTTSGGGSGGGTTPTTARGGTTPTTSGGASGGPATEPRRGDRVSLQDVFVEGGTVTANVRVNDTVYRVVEGQTFATSYRVISLDPGTRCGRFVFGDDQFRLCRGEETVK